MSEQIQNISQKFNDAQNQVRLAIMNFIIDNKRPFSITKDGYAAACRNYPLFRTGL